jgi:diadenosine tetraphosphate (Ap4A) HIT family hydrolase
MSAPACPACDRSWPPERRRIADLGLSIAYLNEDQFFPGWTFLVLKRHATELFALSAGERQALMEELSRVAKAVAEEYGAVKMNYELLGNQVAHIHWHVIPRRTDDPAPRVPVWTVNHAPTPIGGDELTARITSLRRRLATGR